VTPPHHATFTLTHVHQFHSNFVSTPLTSCCLLFRVTLDVAQKNPSKRQRGSIMSSAAVECLTQAPADDAAVIAPEIEVEVTHSLPLVPILPPSLADVASRKVIDPEAIAAYAAASSAAAALAAAGANVAAAAASNAAFVALADDDNAVHLPGF
jgi:hypothetical protein